MHSLILVVMLSSQIWSLPFMFTKADNQPVSMRTQKFTVAEGQFATIAECEDYRAKNPLPFLSADGTFDLVVTDATGTKSASFLLKPTNTYPPPVGYFYVQGCA